MANGQIEGAGNADKGTKIEYMKKFAWLLFILISCGQDIMLSNQITLDCVKSQPTGHVPEDLYLLDSIQQISHYPPFTKKITVCGVTLIARDDVSNLFMKNVAQTIADMFIIHDGTDIALQRELLTNLYRYRTVIPIFLGEDWNLSLTEERLMNQTREENSMCDIIMEGVSGQVTEVIEHILHHISDVGLHYTMSEEWGLSNSSRLYRIAQEAIKKGYYKVDDYSEIEEVEVRNRVILQEYAYWVIYTAWDLKETFGPKESEWLIQTAEELESKLPESSQLYKRTIPKVITCPKGETLSRFIGDTNTKP